MTLTRAKMAEVFDAVADYVEEIEGQKLAAERAARLSRIDTMAERYAHATGESFPDSMRNKLANLDPAALDEIIKMTKTAGESPDSLGSPAELSDRSAPRTVKEAADQAEENFLAWIAS